MNAAAAADATATAPATAQRILVLPGLIASDGPTRLYPDPARSEEPRARLNAVESACSAPACA